MISQKTGMMIVALLLCASPTANGQMIINALDQGWYNDLGVHTPTIPSYAIGYDLPMNRQFRNWFVFPVTGLPATASAALRVYNPISPPYMGNGYMSPDPTETYNLFDVTTTIALLTAGGPPQPATYADLGSGDNYGNRVYSALDNGQYTDIPLTADAVADLNAAAGGFFAIGGAATSLSSVSTQSVFSWSHQSVGVFPPRLVVTAVPEPNSLMLASLGIGVTIERIRRRRQSAIK